MSSALAGGFLAIDRFAFASEDAVWIGFGVAIAATVFSLTAFTVGLLREDHRFSGLSAAAALIGSWTIIALRIFSPATALWLAFAGGVTLLLISLRALALHESTVERVVHALEGNSARGFEAPAAAGRLAPMRRVIVTAPLRAWAYWLIHTGLALAGAFVVLTTFAFSNPGTDASPADVAFAVGIAATVAAAAALLERVLPKPGARSGESRDLGRAAGALITGASMLTAIAMIVTMSVYGGETARWTAFGLGCGLVGLSLLASLMHEITSERVRHELEVTAPAPAPAEASSFATDASGTAATH